MKPYILKTLGCKANSYDSQLIESALQEQGWNAEGGDSSEVQLCIVNSCTVTNEAEKQSRKMAAKLARENPNAVVVMTGCGAEVDPQGLSQSPGVDLVVGNQNKDQLVRLVLDRIETKKASSDILNPSKILGTVKNYTEILSKHPLDREWAAATDSFQTPPTRLKGTNRKTRSFLKIQEGCNSFCTYCIIPYGRGPSRSLRPREILRQVQELVSEGIKEVILTGTNIGDYGTDWGSAPALAELIQLILQETSLERLRVSSLDPTEITDEIIALMEQNPRFCPHFHVSLQSPHSRILRLMKRKYGFDEVKTCLEKISKISAPLGGVFVGMDVITGFPGETEEEFQWTYDSLASLPWNRLHVFPYSERSGTPATRLPSPVEQSTRVEQARKLTQLSLDRLTSHSRQVLEVCNRDQSLLNHVLMENQGEGEWVAGYTPNYIRVLLPRSSLIQRNQLVSVRPKDLMVDSKCSDVALVSTLANSLESI